MKFKCKKCGYSWENRRSSYVGEGNLPKQCANLECRSPRWNNTWKTYTCKRCDKSWRYWKKPKTCRGCQSSSYDKVRVNFMVKQKTVENDNVTKGTYPTHTGMKNARYSGSGVSHYANHYQLKLNRKHKLHQFNGHCEFCDKKGERIFHKDKNKNNHDISNLYILCNRHHGEMNKGRKNSTSKYKKMFGYTAREYAEIHNLSIGKAYYAIRSKVKYG